jgi:multidrug resistance efflux pump
MREGEYISPGMPLITIGDLKLLHVETTDLDEIDVALIDINQNAVITFEALPDETFIGTVDYISPMASSGGGGINYTVNLSLDRMHQKLRWGMTAFVDIETED